MEELNKNLQAYFNKLLEIQKTQENRALNEGELKQIATDLGLSDHDWQAVQDVFNNHYKRANGFLTHKNWEDAIAEFKQALILKPQDVRVLYGLASTYKSQWLEEQLSNDRVKAEEYARLCLEIKADHAGALKLISDLRRAYLSQQKIQKSNQKDIVYGSVILGGLLLFLAGLVFFQLSSPTSNHLETTAETPLITEDHASVAIETYLQENEHLIPVHFIQDASSKNIEFQVEKSIQSIYKNAYSYKLVADLIPHGIEIDHLKLKVEFVDENNQVIHTDFKEIIQDYQPIVRSGDIFPMDYLEHKKMHAPTLKEIRVSVYIIDQQPSPTAYEPSPSVDIQWASTKSTNIDLQLYERRSQYTPSSLNQNNVLHELVLEFKNTGKSSIKKLQTETQWIDYRGNILASKTNYIALTSRPKLKRGQTRIHYVLGQIPNVKVRNIKGYIVTIVDIE